MAFLTISMSPNTAAAAIAMAATVQICQPVPVVAAYKAVAVTPKLLPLSHAEQMICAEHPNTLLSIELIKRHSKY